MKTWYTAQELAGLPGMPSTEQNVRLSLQKNLADTRKKLRGKGLEYALTGLPAETQEYLRSQFLRELFPETPSATETPESDHGNQARRADRASPESLANPAAAAAGRSQV